MRNAQVRPESARDILRTLEAGQKLARIVREMAREIAQLREDNIQLHATIEIYREILRRNPAERIPRKARAKIARG